MVVKYICMVIPLFLSLGCGHNDATELRLSGPAIANQLAVLLEGSKAHLNADEKGKPGCYVQFGGGPSAKRFQFSLPNRVRDLGYAGDITYKINDVNLDKLTVEATAQQFILTATFESKDVELKGSHTWLGDAGVPDIELDRMVLQIKLKPIATKDGSISYTSPEVSFSARVDNTLAPRFRILGNTIDIMDTLTNYRNDLCRAIQQQVLTALDRPERKEALAKQVTAAIASQTNDTSRIQSLRWEGTDLLVSLR